MAASGTVWHARGGVWQPLWHCLACGVAEGAMLVGRVAGARGLATVFRGKELAQEILVTIGDRSAGVQPSQAGVRAGVEEVQVGRPGWRPTLLTIAVGDHAASK